MKLKHVLEGLEYRILEGDSDMDISDLAINSKKVSSNNLFIAIEGFSDDGHRFLAEAVRGGAAAVLIQKEAPIDHKVTKVMVKNTRRSLAAISKNFFGFPSKKLKVTGVTGTNGKTTSCFLLNSILNEAGIPNSLITTVKSYLPGKEVKFDRTTPDPIELNRFFSDSLSLGARSATMEVSSHSIDLGRVDLLDFEGFVFTNLSQDHLDYHKDMESYFEAKRKLFTEADRRLFGGRFAVINIDDYYGKIILDTTDLDTTSFSINDPNADLCAENIKSSIKGIEFDLWFKDRKKIRLISPLCGRFNVYNILGAVGAALNLGVSCRHIVKGIGSLKGVPGRFEKIANEKFTVIVDYAHTPDGLENVLSTAKELLPSGARLITVFGCGGDRDRKKRRMMGMVSSNYSSFSIITSDNPRSEDPLAIIDMISNGFKEKDLFEKIPDRKKAIEHAISLAKKDDIVMIAGKGHEDYQEFKGRRIHFSDQETVREILNSYGKN